MECKWKRASKNFSLTGINRYIMECKYLTTAPKITTKIELIDTLWNVNKVGSVQRKKSR